MSSPTGVLPVKNHMEIIEDHPRVQKRDAFQAATMLNTGIKEILSADPYLDLIPGIRRTDPVKRIGS